MRARELLVPSEAAGLQQLTKPTDCSVSSAGAGGRKAAAAFGSVAERAKWIPLRLDMTERKLLRLLEAALNVSEYTDKVDVLTYRSKTQRIHAQLKDICAILSGLLVASDYRKGQKLLVDRNFSDNAEFFQAVRVVMALHTRHPHLALVIHHVDAA
jgi:hypothetical protein